ncbi:MAG: 50S ribosomal protein L21e [Candidatus Hermodarchaeota archaeon]
MVRKSKGTRFRTRNVFRKSPRKRGNPPLGRLMINYNTGDKVTIIVEPSVQKGMPHRRFHGKVCEVIGQRGQAVILKARDGNATKTLFVRKEHLRPHQP